jgi:glycerol-3-phosphate acyltransferase PlsY
MLWIISGLLTSYLIGSIPTAYLFVRALEGTDIRKFGSGNVGATNASRLLGRKIGILILVLDVVKGLIPVVFIADFIIFKSSAVFSAEILRILFGFSAVVGHIWTVFLNFKGGKGMAVFLGVLLGLALKISGLNIVLFLVLLTWVLIFIISKIVSLASVIATLCLPVYMAFFKRDQALILLSIILSILIILRHKSNLKRIFQGTEPKFLFKK